MMGYSLVMHWGTFEVLTVLYIFHLPVTLVGVPRKLPVAGTYGYEYNKVTWVQKFPCLIGTNKSGY